MPVKASPKRHHFVAEMFQKRFTDESGKLYFYDSSQPKKGVQRGTPKNLFIEKHYYSTIDKNGKKDPALELKLSRLESDASLIIDKIVTASQTNMTPGLTDKEKRTWDLFFITQWKRVPDVANAFQTIENFEETLQRATSEYETNIRPLTDTERNDIQSKKTQARIRNNARVQAVAEPSTEVTDILGDKGLAIITLRHPQKSFIIGSSPIVKFTHHGRTHLSHPSVEVWLPISSNVAVSPGYKCGQEKLIPITDHSVARHINIAIARQSTRFAGRSQALIRSLANPR